MGPKVEAKGTANPDGSSTLGNEEGLLQGSSDVMQESLKTESAASQVLFREAATPNRGYNCTVQ